MGYVFYYSTLLGMLDLLHPRAKRSRKKVVSRNPPQLPSLPNPCPQRSSAIPTVIAPLRSGLLLLRNLLPEQLILQLVGQPLRMLRGSLLRNMDISLTSSSDVEVLALRAGSQRYLGNGHLVFAFRGLHSGRADIGSASSPGAECSIMVISSNSLADDFSISIATGRQFRVKKEGRGVGKTYGVASAPMFPAPVNILDSAQ